MFNVQQTQQTTKRASSEKDLPEPGRRCDRMGVPQTRVNRHQSKRKPAKLLTFDLLLHRLLQVKRTTKIPERRK